MMNYFVKFLFLVSTLTLLGCQKEKEASTESSKEQTSAEQQAKPDSPESVLDAKKILDDTKSKLDQSMQQEQDRLKQVE